MITELILAFIVLTVIIFDINPDRAELSYGNFNLLKGISAILVLIHHISQRIDGIVFINLGYLAVGLFFFISGYSIHQSYLNKNNYLRKILFIKIPSILVSCFFVICLSILIYFFIMHETVTVTELLGIFKGNKFNNWYFNSIIVLYLIFVLSVKIGKTNTTVIIWLFIFITTYEIILILLDFGSHWYLSTYCYFVGTVISNFKEKVLILINKELKVLTIIFIIVFFITFSIGNYLILPGVAYSIVIILLKISSSILFSFVCIFIFYKKRSKKYFDLIGRNSAYMIYFQSLSLDLAEKYIGLSDKLIFAIGVCVLLYLFVFIFGGFITKIKIKMKLI